MGTLSDELAADLAEAVGGYEQTFEWRGRELPCVRTTAPAALLTGLGGDQEEISERITVSYADLVDVPEQGDFLDGNRLQVVKADPNVGHVVLWCAPPMNMPMEMR